MTPRRKWQCWTEDNGAETVMFEGTERQAHAYYRHNRWRVTPEIHVGYDLGLRRNPATGLWEDTEVTK